MLVAEQAKESCQPPTEAGTSSGDAGIVWRHDERATLNPL